MSTNTGSSDPNRPSTLQLDHVRQQFPALSSGYVFADNAGGSQCLRAVAEHISDYLLHTNVQLGADYSVSVESSRRVALGATAATALFNARSEKEIVFGSSSTQLSENLSRALDSSCEEGQEVVITPEHEANGGPWKKLAARRGLTIKYWRPVAMDPENPYSVLLKLDDLLPLITSKTRLIAFTACSNILGSIVPVKDVIKAVRARAKEVGAARVEISVDCVAYAPHRRIDVQDWDVDFCFFSLYKVYGAHLATLYARSESLQFSVASLAHHFLQVEGKGYRLQGPSGPLYELAYSASAVVPYLLSLSKSGSFTDSFASIAAHEQSLLTPLLDFLRAPAQFARGVRVVGSDSVDISRVPTVSFVVAGQRPMRSKDLVSLFDREGGVGIRYGHFYAYTLVDELQPKLDVEDGVVRISLVHYNTIEEVEKIIGLLKVALQ